MGIPYILAGPSGVGKTTISRMLLDSEPDLVRSISFTTRAARVGEENGKSYHFVPVDEFLSMQKRGEFIETASVYDDLYGTAYATVTETLKTKDVLLVLDTQGCATVKAKIPETVIIFLAPPKLSDLKDRLVRRGTESDKVIEKRLAHSRLELEEGLRIADFVIVNDELAVTFFDVLSIIRSCKIMNIDREKMLRDLLS